MQYSKFLKFYDYCLAGPARELAVALILFTALGKNSTALILVPSFIVLAFLLF